MTNRLAITEYQFEQLINLPVVKENYTYYKQEFVDHIGDVHIGPCAKKWIKFAGVDFVVVKDE